MANYIALHVFYGTSYLISNYKYISYAIFLISQDLVLSPVLSLNSSFKWYLLAIVCCRREQQPAGLEIVSYVICDQIWPGWYAQPLQTSLTLLAFACRHWNVRFQKEMWEALDSSGFHCNFCTSSARHWCFYLLHVSCCPYIFFWQGPSVEYFRLSQGLPSTCHVSGFSLMGLRDKNQN